MASPDPKFLAQFGLSTVVVICCFGLIFTQRGDQSAAWTSIGAVVGHWFDSVSRRKEPPTDGL